MSLPATVEYTPVGNAVASIVAHTFQQATRLRAESTLACLKHQILSVTQMIWTEG